LIWLTCSLRWPFSNVRNCRDNAGSHLYKHLRKTQSADELREEWIDAANNRLYAL
jgi:hypothetical protein